MSTNIYSTCHKREKSLFYIYRFGGEHFTLFSIKSFPDIEKMQRNANEDLFVF